MNIFEIVKIKYPIISPEETKIHLAVWSGEDNPIDVFLNGKFEEWQSYQTKRNFQRKYILALIQLNQTDRWLFAGGYISKNCIFSNKDLCYRYDTKYIKELEYFSGKLVIKYKRTGRQSYLNAENWYKNMLVGEIKPEKMVIDDFLGYCKTSLSKAKLDIIISQDIDSWRAALSSVSGVYLITDRISGKLYVGSATGIGGIWQRWREYSLNGHGGNKELKAILKEKGDSYSKNFQFTILEIADTHTSIKDILNRESYWKKVFCSNEFGYNN